MSTNFVHAAKRIKVLFSASHEAGQLVYEKGFFGVVQDDVVSGEYGVLLLEGAWELTGKLGADIVPMGTLVKAAPSTATAVLYPAAPAGSVPSGAVTVGRSIATSNASAIKVQLANPNISY